MAGFVARTREQLITKVQTALEGVSDIVKVVRRVPSVEQLTELKCQPGTTFPCAAIAAGFPVPDEKMSSRFQGKVDLVVSDLAIKINVYQIDADNDTADTTLGSLMSTVWAALLADPTFDGYALETKLRPDPDVEFWPPFVAFQIVAHVKYTHTTGEI